LSCKVCARPVLIRPWAASAWQRSLDASLPVGVQVATLAPGQLNQLAKRVPVYDSHVSVGQPCAWSSRSLSCSRSRALPGAHHHRERMHFGPYSRTAQAAVAASSGCPAQVGTSHGGGRSTRLSLQQAQVA